MTTEQAEHLEKQVAIALRLQTKWLAHMEHLLVTGTITSTDMATLARVLLANGWTLDHKKMPKKLQDMLTLHVRPEDFEDEVNERVDTGVNPMSPR